MEVIRHGQKKAEKRNFICWECDCEYVALQSECRYQDGEWQGDCGYVCRCPDCGAENMGTSVEAYVMRKKVRG